MGKAVIPWRSASEQKARQGSGAGRLIVEEQMGAAMEVDASLVSATTKQDAGMPGRCVQRKFVPAPIWTETMLAALKLGVKGGLHISSLILGLFTMYEAHILVCQSR